MSKALIISLTSIIVILLASLGTFVYFTNFTPEAKAKKVATTYMNAVRANEPEEVKAISATDADTTSLFFKHASLRDYRSTTTAHSDDSFYFLYVFTDEKSPQKARLAVKNEKITELKTGDKLGTLPKDDGPEAQDKTISAESCLSSEDLAYIDSTDLYAHTFRAMTMEFASPTSLVYAGKKNGESIITRLAEFYKKSSEKDYTIELRGYATDDPNEYITMTNLAQNRANKIRNQLIAKDITPDRIVIKKPNVYPKDDDKTDRRRTYVDINITNMCR